MTKNLGLVVEGGGVRALYAAGVLDVLIKNSAVTTGSSVLKTF